MTEWRCNRQGRWLMYHQWDGGETCIFCGMDKRTRFASGRQNTAPIDGFVDMAATLAAADALADELETYEDMTTNQPEDADWDSLIRALAAYRKAREVKPWR